MCPCPCSCSCTARPGPAAWDLLKRVGGESGVQTSEENLLSTINNFRQWIIIHARTQVRMCSSFSKHLLLFQTNQNKCSGATILSITTTTTIINTALLLAMRHIDYLLLRVLSTSHRRSLEDKVQTSTQIFINWNCGRVFNWKREGVVQWARCVGLHYRLGWGSRKWENDTLYFTRCTQS